MSARVGQVNKTPGASYYSGVEADVYEIALDLRPIMTQKVLSSTAGIVRFMLDDETTGRDRLRIDMDYGPNDVNKRVHLIYDFSGAPDDVYDQLRMTYIHFVSTPEFSCFDNLMGHTASFSSNHSQESMIKVITVYPNFSSNLFFVDTKDLLPVGNTYDLEILDKQGKVVLKLRGLAQGEPITFNLISQPTGLYFLHLSGHSVHYVKAIAKKE